MSNVSSSLIVRSKKPFNAETAPDRICATYLTPQSDFYVRSHGEVPKLEAADHRLTIAGRVSRSLNLSMDELRTRFSHRTVTAVMQCAGNRRADMNRAEKVSGDPWEAGAIGNAEWTGISLAEVLSAAGAEMTDGLHVGFACCDEIKLEGERFHYGVSIPMEKARSTDVLLAWAMNGETLTPEHGYPLRVVVPGYAGVRSAKWLTAIEVRDTPSDNHMQAKDYKLLPPHMTKKTVDWDAGMTINEMPLTSAICEPARDAKVPAGQTLVRGYAIASGRGISRVDVSIDKGGTWIQAELDSRTDSPWGWTPWCAQLNLAKGYHELIVRAWDSAGQTQPALPDDTWNFKGYLSVAWHRVPIRAM